MEGLQPLIIVNGVKLSFMINYYFLILIFVIGILTSISDIKLNKIKNKHLILILILSIISYFCLLIFNQINFNFLIKTFVNLFFALIIGIIIYALNFWSSGDAKLFAILSFLIPLSQYKNINSYYPSINFLINFFIIICISLLFQLTKKLNKKEIIDGFNESKSKIKERINLKYFINSFLILFSIQLIIPIIYIIKDFFNLTSIAFEEYKIILILLTYLIIRNTNITQIAIEFFIILIFIIKSFYKRTDKF